VLALLAAMVLFAASRTVEKDIRKQELVHGTLEGVVPL
jgi:hypothetical protein